MGFLPPAPRTLAPAASLETPPQVQSNLFLSGTPTFLTPALRVPPRPTQIDVRIRRADDTFQRGKELYLRGDIETARTEFDRAIDLLLTAEEGAADRNKVEKKMDELIAAIHRYDVNGLGAGDLSGQPGYDRAPLEDILDLTFPLNPTLKPKVNEQLQATTSQLPLEMNDTVLSYINYFSGDRGRKTLLAGLRRAGKYKALISRILAEEKVPQELIYLAQAESGFLPRAVSHKAAVGMWQFVQARGRQYGLMQTSYSDDRLDPEKATRSAARHLRDLYTKFGDWYLAIAGYNCGDGCVEKAVYRTGYADFWTLRSRNAIPKETTNYVPIILAMTIMHKNASAYGLESIAIDEPLQYETLDLSAPTHLALIADAADRPVSDIRELNPSLLTNVAPSSYAVRVPKGATQLINARLDTIPEARRCSWRMHRVTPGDTLESIARHYRMPVGAVASANHAVSVEPGEMLVIPTASEQARMTVRSQKAAGRSIKKTMAAGRKTGARSASKASFKQTSAGRRASSKPVKRKHAGTVQTASLR